MGRSTDAILTYGVHLIDPDDKWLVAEADEYGGISADWLPVDDDGIDLGDAVMNRLLAEVTGFTENAGGREGYYARKWEAEKRLGLELVYHCSDGCTGYVLATYKIRVSRGDVQSLDLAELAARPAANGWDESLATAMRALGLTPKQEKPAWLLCSWWG